MLFPQAFRIRPVNAPAYGPIHVGDGLQEIRLRHRHIHLLQNVPKHEMMGKSKKSRKIPMGFLKMLNSVRVYIFLDDEYDV